MKAVLEFDLNNPEDVEAHLRCVKSIDMACVLFEFTINSREKIAQKIYDKPSSKTPLDIVYEEFNSLLEQHNINIEELIS